jgi:hypothetical protein
MQGFSMRSSLLLLSLALLAPLADAQDRGRGRRGGEPPVIREDAPAQDPAQRPGDVTEQLLGGGAQGNPFAMPPGADDPKQPRPLPQDMPLFHQDRALLRVDGVEIRAAELDELVRYYRSFRPGSNDLLLRDAVEALVPAKVCEAAWGPELPGMKARIDEAFSAVQGGADFARVVQKHSDDTEAPTPDGRYTFGREVAVQPFDMLSHTGRTGELRGPFLTKYGYHFLEVVEYERGEQPAEDRTTVRHVLVMYPAMAEEGVDARELIRQRVAACRIEVLEPALANVVPPALRANVVR